MLDSFEKSTNLGLGLLMYSREKIEEFVEELVKKGEVAKTDARQMASELIKRGEDQRMEMKKLIRNELSKAMENNLISKDDIREIIREEIRQAFEKYGYSQGET